LIGGSLAQSAGKKEGLFCAGSKHSRLFALSLVHERGELLKLYRRHILGEESDNVFDAAFMRVST